MSRSIRQALARLHKTEVRRLPQTEQGRLRLLVAYPNEYRVGMANLGLHAVLEQLSHYPVTVDRAFLPPRKLLDDHRRSGTPLLSLETQTPLPQFDAVFFSVSFEPDYVGLVTMLDMSGVDPLAEQRSDRDPLVIAGGMAPTLNPEPIAPFCDLIGIGEAEVLIPALVGLLQQRQARTDLLEQASRLAGWYVPLLEQQKIARQHALRFAPCHPVILSPRAAFSEHVDIEISRGCRWRCRFCAAGHVVTPYRELDLDSLEEPIGWAVQQRGRVGLVGTDVSDHGHLQSIAEAVWKRGGELALPSLRVESLGRTTGAVSRLVRHQPPQTLTMAIESASEDLRHGLGKRLGQEKILRAAELAADAGVQHLRLYFLVGVLGEQWQDVEAIFDLVIEILRVGPPGRLTLSVTGMVPKAGTPMQWEPAPDRRYLREARQLLRSHLPRDRVELNFESPDWTRWQALLSLGDRDVSRYILAASDRGWRSVLAKAGKEVSLLQGEGRWEAKTLPWRRIKHGSDAQILRQERTRCLDRIYVPPSSL